MSVDGHVMSERSLFSRFLLVAAARPRMNMSLPYPYLGNSFHLGRLLMWGGNFPSEGLPRDETFVHILCESRFIDEYKLLNLMMP